jgi:hypothetical protein
MSDSTGRLLDELSYIVIYAPNFPAEDKTSIEQEMEHVLAGVAQLLQKARQAHSKQLLVLAAQELAQANEAFRSGDSKNGRRLIQEGEEHIREALRPRPRKPSFIAGPAGVLKVPDGEDA